MQLEWANIVHRHTGGDVLLLAPLAVASQTIAEGVKLGIPVHLCRTQADVQPGLNITNYEMLSHFDTSHFVGVVLDESSILKSYMGKTKRALVEAFQNTPYRLCCTATPAPNDMMEIGNHSEFLGVMPSSEMLMRWFINDTMQNGHYRLKGHATKDFWEWVASWAISIKKPSDLGYSDDGFALPELRIHHRYIETDITIGREEGHLFRAPMMSATNLHKEMRITAADRAQAVADLVNASHGLLTQTGNCNKLATCGRKNMPNAAASNIKQTHKNAPDDVPKAELPKKTESTCKSITHQTANDLTNIGGCTQTNVTSGGESDTQATPNTVNVASRVQSSEIRSQNEMLDCEPNSALVPRNMTTFLQNKTESVQSAANLRLAETNMEPSDFPLTMITRAAKSEDCSVLAATSVSASSGITPSSCDEPQTTSPQNQKPEPWVVWCNTNYEQEELEKQFGDRAFSVYGSLSSTEKERRILGWLNGERPILISKPSICGFGLNFQHCHHAAFVGLSYSFEDFYQAVRRLYRFGQKHPVEATIIAAETESSLVTTLERKIQAQIQMSEAMNASASRLTLQDELQLQRHETFTSKSGTGWQLYHGDCVTVTHSLPSESVHFSIFSPPFSSLYIYSDALEDMGNAADDEEFFRHFDFLIPELLRVTKPGRLCAVHCKDLVRYKGRDGTAGLRDFSGEIVRHFSAAGWSYHSKVIIWKDPVIEMQRTKAHGLLYKQLRADSTFSRQGMPEYLLIFRKWPQNEEEEGQIEPVTHTKEDFPLEIWQRYASPVWFDIRQTNVLNVEQARESPDEKHICPLQLDVIERCIRLWSNPGETVFSPFAGIGSEGYEALRLGRTFVGIELKEAYIQAAHKNLERILRNKTQATLFDDIDESEVIA
jgi:DNA modification methylase